MAQPTSLDDIVDIVATYEPATPADILEHTDADEIDFQQAENLLSIALERERILKVNGKFWVMRVGKYADNVD